jgi:hypothetical protein
MSVGKPAPRFLPTLTEVVYPVATVAAPELTSELLVERLLQRVAPTVEAQLRETLRSLVQEQMRLLEPRFQQEIESAVTRAVAIEMRKIETSGV